MTSTTEQTETAAAKTAEPKPTEKARVGARRAHVAPAKATSGKKASPAKKAPKRRARAKVTKPEVRAGSKTARILAMLKRPGGATSKELIVGDRWQKDGPCRYVHQERRRRAELLHQVLIRAPREPFAPPESVRTVPRCRRLLRANMEDPLGSPTPGVHPIVEAARRKSCQLVNEWPTQSHRREPFRASSLR
jgi:hypothetical protein